MVLSVLTRLAQADPADWNALAGNASPFLRHEFLSALEETGCVGPGTGWLPQHLALHSEGPGRGALLGAIPLYIKEDSYGEYVFDWSWARAYHQAGGAYYPKLVAAVPFTPATGSRLLIRPGVERGTAAARLIEGARELTRERGASSLHWLFPLAEEAELLAEHGHERRVGVQFHWTNPGYRDFADFLSTFTAEKRKKIRQERRYVQQNGVSLRVRAGSETTPAHWDTFYRFYRDTIDRHGAIAYLNRAFFRRLAETLPDSLVLTLAEREGRCVGAAFALRGSDALYGRYWGGDPGIRALHFETCYYTPIEFCIAEGIKRYEAGAQGEHKLARGFSPTATHSAHWMCDARFSRAVADYLAREREGVAQYVDELNEHSPYRRPALQSDPTPPGAGD